MSNGLPASNQQIELRKYPNRRYYDVTRSRHVTLEDIHGLIRSGHDIRVTDSKTGEDITAKVLAQIILDHDPPKLGAFPVELLHQLIRANEPIFRDFVDKYFNQALKAFLESQRQFDLYLRQALGLHPTLPIGQDWARMMMGPFAPAFFSPARSDRAVPDGSAAAASEQKELRQTLEELKRQVAQLQEEIEGRPRDATSR
jgi:polyhydroxyalkanoate synthesis repressor PhaR